MSNSEFRIVARHLKIARWGESLEDDVSKLGQGGSGEGSGRARVGVDTC
jgi:hypothetical protein